MYWTRDVTRAIASGTHVLKQYLKYQRDNIDKLVDKVRGKLSKLERKALGALTTIDVHARDVLVEQHMSTSVPPTKQALDGGNYQQPECPQTL